MASRTDETAQELLEVTMMLMRSLSSSMRECEPGLSPIHVGIMARVSELPCTITELARHQSVRLPTMSRSVSLLVERGFVERTVSADNRRQSIVSLTSDGKRVLSRMKHHAQRHVARVLKPLNAAERGKVHTGLKILGRMLAPTGSPTDKKSTGDRLRK